MALTREQEIRAELIRRELAKRSQAKQAPEADLEEIEPGIMESAAIGLAEGATGGFTGEILGAASAGLQKAKGLITGEETRPFYDLQQEASVPIEKRISAATDAHPIVEGISEIPGYVLSPLSKVGGAGKLATLAKGAMYAGGKSEHGLEEPNELAKDIGFGTALTGVLSSKRAQAAAKEISKLAGKGLVKAGSAIKSATDPITDTIGYVAQGKSGLVTSAFKRGLQGLKVSGNATQKELQNMAFAMPPKLEKALEEARKVAGNNKQKVIQELDKKVGPSITPTLALGDLLDQSVLDAKKRFALVPSAQRSKGALVQELSLIRDNVLFKNNKAKSMYQKDLEELAEVLAHEEKGLTPGQMLELEEAALEDHGKIVDKYIRKLKPSEVDKLKQDLYERLGYNKTKVKAPFGNFSIELPESLGGMAKKETAQLKDFAAKTKNYLNDLADANELDLRGANEKFENLSNLLDMVPRSSAIRAEAGGSITQATDNLDTFLRNLDQTEPELAKALKSQIGEFSDLLELMRRADRGGFQRNSLPGEGVFLRAANQAGVAAKSAGEMARGYGQRMGGAGQMMSAAAVPMSQYGSAISEQIMPNAQAGSIADLVRQAGISPVAQALEQIKIPRTTEGVKTFSDAVMAKLVMSGAIPLAKSFELAIKTSPEKIHLFIPSFIQQIPDIFERSEYSSEFDGKISDPIERKTYLNKLQKREDVSNTEKAKRAHLMNKDGTITRDPQSVSPEIPVDIQQLMQTLQAQ